MSTILFSDQVQHGTGTVKEKLNELLDRAQEIIDSDYISQTTDIDFSGQVTINGQIILTGNALQSNNFVKYNDHLPSFSDTTAIRIPAGNTSDRPVCGDPGLLRYNIDRSVFEGWNGTDWFTFETHTTVSNPIHTEQIVINPDSFWEYDTWCIFGDRSDAALRTVLTRVSDPVNASITHGLMIDAVQYATVAIKDSRFIRVYNTYTSSLLFQITIK